MLEVGRWRLDAAGWMLQVGCCRLDAAGWWVSGRLAANARHTQATAASGRGSAIQLLGGAACTIGLDAWHCATSLPFCGPPPRAD